MNLTTSSKAQPEAGADIAKLRYDRNAWFFDPMETLVVKILGQEDQRKMIAQAKGRVLEVGIGTGESLTQYPEGVELVGIDISPKMLARAKAKARAREYPGTLTLLVGDVQALDFPDDSFDTVITSCVFCSVTDPVRGFEEINRVLRPGGIGLHLEHVRSDYRIIGKLMDILNPAVARMMGANINRDTATNIRKAGLELLEEKNLWLDILKLFKVTKGANGQKGN